jgi:hypothetical protein
MPDIAPQIRSMSVAETRTISVDFSGKLDDGESLTGTPVATEPSGTIALSGEVVSSTELTINGEAVAAGLAVQFVADASVTGRYLIDIVVSTDASQVLEGRITLVVTD